MFLLVLFLQKNNFIFCGKKCSEKTFPVPHSFLVEKTFKDRYNFDFLTLQEKHKESARVQTIFGIVPEIEGLYPIITKLLTAGNTDDEEKLRDLMVSAQKDIDILIDKNRIFLGHKEKTMHIPLRS